MNQLTQLGTRRHKRPDTEDAHEILRWATEEFASRIALSTSLGPQTLVILDMLARLERLAEVHVFFLDTGLLFPETYALRRRVEEHYGIRIDAIRPHLDLYDQERMHGAALWRTDPDRCCQVRKVEPLLRALRGAGAYITGLRRDQSQSRQALEAIGWDMRLGMTKINPLVGWTREQVFHYLRDHDVPRNPLLAQGYPSIGCAPCTSQVALVPLSRRGQSQGADRADDMDDTEIRDFEREYVLDERAGRWAGTDKTECGLHFPDGATTQRSERP